MFQVRLFDDKQYQEGSVVYIVSIKCINCNRETVLYLINTTIEGRITKFVINEILYHVDMSWIICSNKELFYEIDESNHPNWLNKGPWYNT